MRTQTFLVLATALSFGGSGCKFFEKKVPDNIVQQAFEQTMRRAPATASAMCGAKTNGFASAKITIKSRGENNKGVVHVKGTPWPGKDLPDKCEGDIEYSFTYKTRTWGTKKNRKTETTWFLERIKLIDVQTEGVKFKEGKDETPDDDAEGGDDDDKSDKDDKKDDKKKKKDKDDE